jgi:tripartite-type tricarboxylate transporter receptor subunit TctC
MATLASHPRTGMTATVRAQRLILLILLSLALCIPALAPGDAAAQAYPVKPVRIIVAYPAGGSTDIFARIVAQKLIERWGQQVVIDNRGGATGMIGAEAAVRSAPDGYTILANSLSEVAVNQNFVKKMPYDPLQDLIPVTLGVISPIIWVTHPSLPAKTVKELAALAKARPGQIAYSTPGTGSVHHIAGEWFRLIAKIDMTPVPYKGGGPQIVDQLGGHTVTGLFTLVPVAPHVRSGRLRAIAVTSGQRFRLFPDVPTLVEQGFPIELTVWYGISLPAHTPRDIVQKVNTDVGWALHQTDAKSRLIDQGFETAPNSLEQHAAFVRAESEKYRKVIREAGIKLDL